MGCVSSKIMTKSSSFRDEFNRKFQTRTNSLEEILVSKNGGDQFVALLCTANTIAKRLKEVPPPAQEPNVINNSPNPISISIKEPEKNEIETIDASELLAGLEDDDPIAPSSSFHTLEEYDALVAENSEESELMNERRDREECNEKGSKRKAMRRELSALKVPAAFEFSREWSLRDWLLKGPGQVVSPGSSYITPKFGNFVSPGDNESNGDETTVVFDPELVAQFEQAMEELTMEEESILKGIIESLEGGNNEE